MLELNRLVRAARQSKAKDVPWVGNPCDDYGLVAHPTFARFRGHRYACLPRLKSLRPVAIPSAQHGDQEQRTAMGIHNRNEDFATTLLLMAHPEPYIAAAL